MSEASYKIGRRKGFTIIYRSVAQDKRLSLKARGLFLLMQSLPDDWTFTQSGLASTAGVGRDQIRAALKELETIGYLVREQAHNDGGHFAGNVWILQEEAPAPSSENPTTVSPEHQPSSGNPSSGNPTAENPTLQNTIDTNNTPLPPTGECACVSEKPKAKRAPRAEPKWKPERFAGFWKFYARHGRPDAYSDAVKAWDKLKADDETIDRMGAALSRQIKGDLWTRGIGIPYASTWLNKRKWETPPDAPAPDDKPLEMEVTGWNA